MIFLDQLLSNGISDANPAYLNEKIKTTNIIGVFFTLLVIPFYFVFNLVFHEIAYWLIFFVGATLATVFLNSLNLYNLSRFVLIVGSSGVYFILHCYLMQDDQEPQGILFLLTSIFFILPWTVFDFREKFQLLFYNLYCISLLFLVPYCNPIFTYVTDISLIQDGYLFYVFVATFGVAFCVPFYLSSKNVFDAEKRNNDYILELNKKNEAFNENEAKLNSYITEIENSQKEEKKRSWASDGMAQFVEVLRTSNSELTKLSDTIISKLVHYLKVNQGSIFVLNEENSADPYLDLTAVYAYDRKRFINKRVEIGQGMVGQAFLEKDVIYLKKVPQDYVQITSGLGKATPESVIIVPLIINEKAYGVIELASFGQFEPFEIDFLKKLGENIAGTFANVRANEKMLKLLEDAQLSQEQLRSQEEEVRQNMEELQATQEELARKSQEIDDLRKIENEKAESQMALQRKMLQQYVAEAEQREEELKAKILELEAR